MESKTLETERLLLRRARAGDETDMLEIRNSGFVLQYNPMQTVESPEKMRELVLADAENPNIFYMELKETGRVIGMIELERDSLRHGVKAMSVSYYLGEQYAKKGYMSEAMPQVFARAFDELGLDVLSARIFYGNEASVRLMQHCGMTLEARLRHGVRGSDGKVYDDLALSILRDEYYQKRS